MKHYADSLSPLTATVSVFVELQSTATDVFNDLAVSLGFSAVLS